MTHAPPPRARTARRLAPAALALAAATGACTTAGEQAPAAAAHDDATLFTVPAAQRARLQVVKAVKEELVRPIEVPALVGFDDLKTSAVTPLVSGKVSRVLVHEGDKVKAGQGLLMIASPDSSDVSANLARDQAELRSKQTILARDNDLYAHKAISLEELQQATLDVDAAKTTVQNDEMHAVLTGSKTGDALLRSPIAGVVVSRQVSVGDVVQADATPCFTITDPSALWVVSQLYQEDVRRVELGDAAKIRSPVLDAPVDGKVTYIGASLDPGTLTIPVRIAAENPGGLLKKGMYVTVDVIPAKPDDAVVVPAAAVLRDEDNLPFVYIQQAPGTFARRRIELGEQVADSYTIAQGLAGGEQILADGALFVQFADSLER